jgi:hypothetical protein
MRVDLPKAARPGTTPPGHWSPLRDGGRWSASIACPQCGVLATLTDHSIAADGTVSPSVVCPTSGCSWHVQARLLGWGT